jgi:hypothetical protein
MVMSQDSDVRSWLNNLPDKHQKIDVVTVSAPSRACIERARILVRQAGYSNVAIRQGSESEYSDLLRATTRR